MSHGRTGRSAQTIAIVCLFVLAGCGKKGPPLPPLVRIPAAPADLKAERRGSKVDLEFTVPNANSDGTRPANIQRVDIYGFTGPETVSDDELLKKGQRIGSVDVKAPRDPDRTIDPGEPRENMEPLQGSGLDQGALARVEEQLDPPAVSPRSDTETAGPLLGPSSAAVPPRTYVGFGVSKRGRRGPISKRVAVPLGPAPAPPDKPSVTYNESNVVVTWTPAPSTSIETATATDGGVLPSTPIGAPPSKIAYRVYDNATGRPLTAAAITESRFSDNRIEWGVERCYTVRAVETIGALSVESDPSEAGCATLTDTFPPAHPKGLNAVPTAGAINLIWQPNTEKDLAGYIVLRGVVPADMLEPITLQPIQEPNFTDGVQPGMRFVYAVQAVDKSGNRSEPSERVEETAR